MSEHADLQATKYVYHSRPVLVTAVSAALHFDCMCLLRSASVSCARKREHGQHITRPWLKVLGVMSAGC